MPFRLGLQEILLILAFFTLFFGAKRIPEIAAGIGKGIRSFKSEMKEPPASLEPGDDDQKQG